MPTHWPHSTAGAPGRLLSTGQSVPAVHGQAGRCQYHACYKKRAHGVRSPGYSVAADAAACMLAGCTDRLAGRQAGPAGCLTDFEAGARHACWLKVEGGRRLGLLQVCRVGEVQRGLCLRLGRWRPAGTWHLRAVPASWQGSTGICMCICVAEGRAGILPRCQGRRYRCLATRSHRRVWSLGRGRLTPCQSYPRSCPALSSGRCRAAHSGRRGWAEGGGVGPRWLRGACVVAHTCTHLHTCSPNTMQPTQW